MDPSEFNDTFLKDLLQKITNENKTIMLMGDFNIDILQYDSNKDSENFLDTMYSNFLLPYVTAPTQLTTRSQTLIDNIFYNEISKSVISGNFSTSISDHLTQFLIVPSNVSDIIKKEPQLFRSYKNMNKESIKIELENTNWNHSLETVNNNASLSFELLNKKISSILDRHCPKFKQKNQKILYSKPWITTGIAHLIKVKNRLYKQFCNAKNIVKKEEIFNRFKAHRNYLTNLLRTSKDDYYKLFFEENKTKTKNIWNGIRNLINLKGKTQASNITLDINNQTTTDIICL